MVTNIVQVLLALVFIMAGGTKLMGLEMHVTNFKDWGYPSWFRIFTGLWEVLGSIALVWGIWSHKVAAPAGVWLMIVMAGATYTHLFRAHDGGWIMTVPIFLLAGFVAYGRWEATGI